MTNLTPVLLPILDRRGVETVPDFVDALSPKVKAARKAADKAAATEAAARKAAADASARLRAVSTLSHSNGTPTYSPAPTASVADFDAARIAVAEADTALATATRAAKRATDAFLDTAAREGHENPALIEAVEARFAELDTTLAEAFAAARELLHERDTFDRMLGIPSLRNIGLYALQKDGNPGDIRRYRLIAEGFYDRASVLREAEAYFAPVASLEVTE